MRVGICSFVYDRSLINFLVIIIYLNAVLNALKSQTPPSEGNEKI